MKGRNVLYLNEATLKDALEKYFSNMTITKVFKVISVEQIKGSPHKDYFKVVIDEMRGK